MAGLQLRLELIDEFVSGTSINETQVRRIDKICPEILTDSGKSETPIDLVDGCGIHSEGFACFKLGHFALLLHALISAANPA